MRILLIEDDMILGAAVRDHIIADSHSVDWVARLDVAADHVDSAAYDLVLPDGQGIAFLRELRRKGSVTPVIILTALDQISGRINGLNAGADDYMIKPFDLSELSARLSAVARRYSGNPNPLIEIGDFQVDLSAREWAFFEAFIQHPGQILPKTQLEERLYAFGSEVESNTIEVHVCRLRKKLARSIIETAGRPRSQVFHGQMMVRSAWKWANGRR
jgi:two-component system OmpR family response regulator